MDPTVAPPSKVAMVFATALAVGASLIADVIVIAAGTHLFPSTRGFSHFRVFDYASLTAIGVVVACVAWPMVIRVSSSPRWLFFRLAIISTLVLWLPDVWLLLRHESPQAVGLLMVMHLLIAIITYNTLVHVAVPQPLGSTLHNDADARDAQPSTVDKTDLKQGSMAGRAGADARAVSRSTWILLMSASCLEFAVGIAALMFVPFTRPNAWIPIRGEIIYLVHAILGAILTIGAIGVLIPALRQSRMARIGSIIGVVGVIAGAIGGMLAVYHASRLIGMALMLVGVALAFFGYLTPIIEPQNKGDLGASSQQAN